MGTFISSDAILWASQDYQKLPQDQLLLIFLLALSKVPNVQYPQRGVTTAFELELFKYIGVQQGSAWKVLNPFSGSLRAENYYNSTVMGRLLNGSHVWTQKYLDRTPSAGWPARFNFKEQMLLELKHRSTPPCLSAGKRLSKLATAILYYKTLDLDSWGVTNPKQLVALYESEVLELHPDLSSLFESDDRLFWGDLVSPDKLSESEILSALAGGVTPAQLKTVKIYQSDAELMTKQLSADDSIADFIHRLLLERNN